MNCQEYIINLTAYLDQELPGTDRTSLESHLSACPKCREELESLRESATLFDSKVREVEPGPALWNNVRARITAIPSPGRAPGIWDFPAVPRWTAVAAAAAAVIVLALSIRTYQQHQGTQKALTQYMTQYVQVREAQEVEHRAPPKSVTRVLHKEYSENPFVTSSEDPQYSNPFREQGQ